MNEWFGFNVPEVPVYKPSLEFAAATTLLALVPNLNCWSNVTPRSFSTLTSTILTPPRL